MRSYNLTSVEACKLLRSRTLAMINPMFSSNAHKLGDSYLLAAKVATKRKCGYQVVQKRSAE
jgi:hypothetical protein